MIHCILVSFIIINFLSEEEKEELSHEEPWRLKVKERIKCEEEIKKRERSGKWDRRRGWKIAKPPRSKSSHKNRSTNSWQTLEPPERPGREFHNFRKLDEKDGDEDKGWRKTNASRKKNMIEFMLVPLLLGFLASTMLCALLYKLCAACNGAGAANYATEDDDDFGDLGVIESGVGSGRGRDPIGALPRSERSRARTRPQRRQDASALMVGVRGPRQSGAPKQYRLIRLRGDTDDPSARVRGFDYPRHPAASNPPVPPPYEEVESRTTAQPIAPPPRGNSPPPTYDEAIEQG